MSTPQHNQSLKGLIMGSAIIQVSNIKKSFTSGTVTTDVLKDISFSINRGEYVAISGPSGCGKSTLLNILGLLDNPDSGEYFIDNENVSRMTKNQKADVRSQKIGIVFQSFNLIDDFSVLENVALPLKYRGDNTQARTKRAQECLSLVGLEDKQNLYPNQLSGGQQQRVSIARALAGDSGILLVDEPTGNLDSKNGDAVMQLLSELNANGTTICLETHDPRYADMADRKIMLLDGKVN